MKKERKLGPEQQKLLDFARKCVGWHTYSKDRNTRRVVRRMAELGYIEDDPKFCLFRIKRKRRAESE